MLCAICNKSVVKKFYFCKKCNQYVHIGCARRKCCSAPDLTLEKGLESGDSGAEEEIVPNSQSNEPVVNATVIKTVMSEWLVSGEFSTVLESVIAEFTSPLLKEITRLREELAILKESNIELIHLMSGNIKQKVVNLSTSLGNKNVIGTEISYLSSGKSKQESRSTSQVNDPKLAAIPHLPKKAPELGPSASNDVTSVPHEEPFVPVKNRPKRKRPVKPLIIGTNESKAEAASGTSIASDFTGCERRQWVYVGRVSSSITAETMKDCVKSTWKVSDVSCVPLAKNEDACSFKVGVPESVLESLLDASKWPKFVAVREFVYVPKFQRRDLSKKANFPEESQSAAPV